MASADVILVGVGGGEVEIGCSACTDADEVETGPSACTGAGAGALAAEKRYIIGQIRGFGNLLSC